MQIQTQLFYHLAFSSTIYLFICISDKVVCSNYKIAGSTNKTKMLHMTIILADGGWHAPDLKDTAILKTKPQYNFRSFLRSVLFVVPKLKNDNDNLWFCATLSKLIEDLSNQMPNQSSKCPCRFLISAFVTAQLI